MQNSRGCLQVRGLGKSCLRETSAPQAIAFARVLALICALHAYF